MKFLYKFIKKKLGSSKVSSTKKKLKNIDVIFYIEASSSVFKIELYNTRLDLIAKYHNKKLTQSINDETIMKMLDNFSKKWSLAGKSEILDINKRLGCSIPEGADYHTLAGFLLEKFQMVPKIGDILDFNNIKFEVVSMSGPKIDRVKIILPKS